MNKIQVPQKIIYRKLTFNNINIQHLFEKYLSLNEIVKLQTKDYFKFNTNLFKKYYNKYKPFYHKNSINLTSYLQFKKKKLIEFTKKINEQPNLLIEWIIPNHLLILEYSYSISI